MYWLTSEYGEMAIGDAFATIDAAIEAARTMSRTSEIQTIMVREGTSKGRRRVRAKQGKAYWLVPCKKCKETGALSGGAFGLSACDACNGATACPDMPCA